MKVCGIDFLCTSRHISEQIHAICGENRGQDRYTVFAMMDGDQVAGVAVLDPDCRYFGRSIHIRQIAMHWQYNVDENIIFLLREAIASCGAKEAQLVAIDVLQKRDMNRPALQKMGFTDSLMKSPVSNSHVVMVAQKKEVLMEQKCKLYYPFNEG